MAELNSPVSLEEAQACMLLPTGRAADLQGLTGELLRGAGSEVPVPGQDVGRAVCPPGGGGLGICGTPIAVKATCVTLDLRSCCTTFRDVYNGSMVCSRP
jgi:hypothetical protein